MLDSKLAFAGATSNLPIFASCLHPDPLGGFQVAVRYDKVALTLSAGASSTTALAQSTEADQFTAVAA